MTGLVASAIWALRLREFRGKVHDQTRKSRRERYASTSRTLIAVPAGREEVNGYHLGQFACVADQAVMDGNRSPRRGGVWDCCAASRRGGQRRVAGGRGGVHLFHSLPLLRAVRRRAGARC